MYLIFDTETTGLPKDWNAPITDVNNWPRVVQIAWQLHDELGKMVSHEDFLIKPEGFNIPYDAENIHGISTELAVSKGVNLKVVLKAFEKALAQADFVVGQNISFDLSIMCCELYRADSDFLSVLQSRPVLDTCTEATATLCKIPGGKGGKFKLPNLTELHQYLFSEDFEEAHNATADVEATTRCFLELVRTEHFTEVTLQKEAGYLERFKNANPTTIETIGLTHQNLKKESEKLRKKERSKYLSKAQITANEKLLENTPFTHLHNYTQYSVLQSTTRIDDLIKKATQEKMSAVAITDKANLMGAFQFVEAVAKHNKNLSEGVSPLKSIVGCEFFICEDHRSKKPKDKGKGYQMVFLAKNKNGYQNISKMSSIAYVDGFYCVPRIDKEIVKKYSEDIIVLTGGIQGEIPQKILSVGDAQAEKALLWWKDIFGDDLYIELIRHGNDVEASLNQKLINFASKHAVKTVATNQTFYLEKNDANAHDILLCVKEGEQQATPIGRGRGFRYGLEKQEYYFKSPADMKKLFVDVPEAIINTQEIVDKITPFQLARDVLLPVFDIPRKFIDEKDLQDGGRRGENNYLKHLAYEGAKMRYGTPLIDQLTKRLDFELNIIAKTGYPGYFLIVYDLIKAAIGMGVSVGPGRGSAAGSVVAYCLQITNIDPIAYDLLFERFLNPERVSMPDIDIDFDDKGRDKVIDYVIKKYGESQVAQIITYGKMGAKSAVRDTARVLEFPLQDANRIAKLLPNNQKLQKILSLDEKGLKKELKADEVQQVLELKKEMAKNTLTDKVIKQAQILEGSLRNTGVHACGVIITPDDITKYVPVTTAKDKDKDKDSDMYLSQFDNSVVENAGLLKMDFLGLKTLTIIKDAVEIVHKKYKKKIDIEALPLDDKKTYELFQRGDTIGIFQYESGGMQKSMRDLKPTVFEDLIAMNALYRPGPMDYIPSFINRKHGKQKIIYDLPEMEEYLAETYGITVYQEQVMLLSQKLAGFTKGEADVLRKAMGKKQAVVLEKMKPQFVTQAIEKGYPKKNLEKIWADWEAFASYAFNKSHSTCYAFIAYQTAYLKAHYPAAYMAALLSNNMSNLTEVTKIMNACKIEDIKVLGPNVNESDSFFSVNEYGAIRFGMAAIKGVGEAATETIVKEREKNGAYTSVFDMLKRLNISVINKRVLEGLAYAGAFDTFQAVHRAQYFSGAEGNTFIETLLTYAKKYHTIQNSLQQSLFGDTSEMGIMDPTPPQTPEWNNMERLKKEKEVVGFYISSHPLNDFKYPMQFCNSLAVLSEGDLTQLVGRSYFFGGMLTTADHRTSKKGTGWARFTLMDYDASFEFRMFGQDYISFKNYLDVGRFIALGIEIKEGWRNKETGKMSEPRINFMNFIQLGDLLENKVKSLLIKIPLIKLSKHQTDTLKKILVPYQKGENRKPLFIEFGTEKNTLKMKSRTTTLQITTELLQDLENKGIDFVLQR